MGKWMGVCVLGGKICWGDGDVIDVVILFCDLCYLICLEVEFGWEIYVVELNWFFEVMMDVVNEYDGEVFKFIGDVVLVIFLVGEDWV